MNLTNKCQDIKNLLDSPNESYWHDTDTDWYYFLDKPSQSWIRTTECPFDPEFIKKLKVTQLDRIETKLDKLLST